MLVLGPVGEPLWQVCTAEKAPPRQPEKSVVELRQFDCILLVVRAISYQRPD
jgi:hypothetical protein